MHTHSASQPGPDEAGQPGAVARGRLPRAAGVTAGAAWPIDLLVYAIAAALWGVPGEFSFFNPLTIVVMVAGGVAIAAVGLAVLARLTRRPVPIFVAVAGVVTLLSLGLPFQAMAGMMPGVPAATTATGVTMIVLHLLTGGIIAGGLPALARR
ncbi:MAG TPA: DUF6069 family protein [Chloroflexota bacterium]|nr:DUF6069 family protein [Chloroflexota bacterium]